LTYFNNFADEYPLTLKHLMTTPRPAAKPKKARRVSNSSANNQGGDFSGFFKMGTAAIKEIGIPGFVVTFLCFVFWQYADIAQKKDFIDIFFLFKNIESNKFPYGLVVVVLIATMIFQHVFYKKDLKLTNKELERVSEEKKQLQEILNKKQLNTSK
jgi:hypothetical protein